MSPGIQTIAVATLAALLASPPASACSFFVVRDGETVLAGNNEDFHDPDTWVWYVPAHEKRHGCVYFGYGNRFPQGGMNDRGLFFDGAATERLKVKNTDVKKKRPLAKLLTDVMEECATVDEVIVFLKRHDLSDLERAQLLYADATGDSVLVEGDVMIRGSGRCQITTNFYQSQLKGAKTSCERYTTAERMLTAPGTVSVDLVRKTLAAVHQEGAHPTQYSTIYDLVKLEVHVYHFHNFEEVRTIDLKAELAKGPHATRIRELVEESFAAREYRWRHRKR